jgi:hypothetical protein
MPALSLRRTFPALLFVLLASQAALAQTTAFTYQGKLTDNNGLLGFSSLVTANLTNATAIGANASVTQSNSLVLGSINGVNGATADTSVGIGTTAPAERLHVSGTGIIRARVNSDSNAGLALTLNNQPGWSVATVTGGQFQIFNDANPFNAVWIDATTNNVGILTTCPLTACRSAARCALTIALRIAAAPPSPAPVRQTCG